MTFKQTFFRIYDRKIASGEITFSQTGISRDEFTRLCTEEGYVLEQSVIEKISTTMKLTDEEKELLMEGAQVE